MNRLDFLRHVKKLVILAIFSDVEFMERLVLKGGNLLDVVFNLSIRASVDIDLSMDGEYDDEEALRQKVLSALELTLAAHGFVLFDFRFQSVPPQLSDDLKDFWGGYKVAFKIIETDKHEQFGGNLEQIRRNACVIGKGDSTVFKVDISRHEFCDEKERYDLDNFSVYGYSPAMFVAEKVRAICQQMEEYARLVKLHPRSRARDFVDIKIVADQYGIDFGTAAFQQTICKVFAKKRVPLRLIGSIPDFRELHEIDFPAVRATVLPDFHLEEFGFYFDSLCRRCAALEPLWRE